MSEELKIVRNFIREKVSFMERENESLKTSLVRSQEVFDLREIKIKSFKKVLETLLK